MAFIMKGYAPMRAVADSMGGEKLYLKKEGDTKTVHFLDNEPTGVFEHSVQDLNFRSFTCLEGSGEQCPLCEAGNPKRYIGYFPVLDTDDNKVKMFGRGITDVQSLAVLDGMMSKYAPDGKGNLTFCAIQLTKSGTGKKSKYNFFPIPNIVTTPDMLKRVGEINFENKLAPKKRAELMGILGGGGSSAKEDDPVSSFE